MNIAENLDQFYKIEITAEPILIPKRIYKRPDLQRLANRWYGMKKSGRVCVQAFLRPKQEQIREPVLPDCPAWSYLDPRPIARSVSFKVKTYELPLVGFTNDWQESEWRYNRPQIMEMIMYHVREFISQNTKVTTH